MNALLAASSLALAVAVIALIPDKGAGAVGVGAAVALAAGLVISRLREDREFLTRLFVAGLLARVFVGTVIYYFNFQEFFGGDAYTYDYLGQMITRLWHGELSDGVFQGLAGQHYARNFGMGYVNGAIYFVLGESNMLAVQFVNAVIGAATAPVIYHCARLIFQNLRVARLSALFVTFFPSLILWSSQGLKDGPMVFLLALAMLATLRIDKKFSVGQLALLVAALGGILSLRFYVFYIMAAACGSAFVVGIGAPSLMGYARRFAALLVVSLILIQLGGGLGSMGQQLETYGNLEAMQRSRADLAGSAKSGFGEDVDVSTASGALSVIPLGMVYLLFAPFPWQLASLRQSITLPEMLVWWGSFPLLVTGLWFTLRHRMRQALPILIFTMMLTLAYSVFQGNVGTAYRQRSQLLVFYFIFVSVGYVLMKERREKNVKRAAREEAASKARGARAGRVGGGVATAPGHVAVRPGVVQAGGRASPPLA